MRFTKFALLLVVGFIVGLMVNKSAYAEEISGSCKQGGTQVLFSITNPDAFFGMIAELRFNEIRVYAQKITKGRDEEEIRMFIRGASSAYTLLPLELFNNGVPLKLGQDSGTGWIECTLSRN